MTNPSKPSGSTPRLSTLEISKLKSEAKCLKKEKGIKHSDALDLIAKSLGFDSWDALANSERKYKVEVKGNTVFVQMSEDEPPLKLSFKDFEIRNSVGHVDAGRASETEALIYEEALAVILENPPTLYINQAEHTAGEPDEGCFFTFEMPSEDELRYPRLLRVYEDVSWGDCWVKLHEKPALDQYGRIWLDGVYCDVRSPGQHPGGNTWWLTPVFKVNAIGSYYAPMCHVEGDYSGDKFETPYEAEQAIEKLAEDTITDSFVEETCEAVELQGGLKTANGDTLMPLAKFNSLGLEEKKAAIKRCFIKNFSVCDAFGNEF